MTCSFSCGGHLPSMEDDRRWPMGIGGCAQRPYNILGSLLIHITSFSSHFPYYSSILHCGSSSNVHRSSSIIFHWWKMTPARRWPLQSYQYPDQPKHDIRPFSTSSNVHRLSSIDLIDSGMEIFGLGDWNFHRLMFSWVNSGWGKLPLRHLRVDQLVVKASISQAKMFPL